MTFGVTPSRAGRRVKSNDKRPSRNHCSRTLKYCPQWARRTALPGADDAPGPGAGDHVLVQPQAPTSRSPLRDAAQRSAILARLGCGYLGKAHSLLSTGTLKRHPRTIGHGEELRGKLGRCEGITHSIQRSSKKPVGQEKPQLDRAA